MNKTVEDYLGDAQRVLDAHPDSVLLLRKKNGDDVQIENSELKTECRIKDGVLSWEDRVNIPLTDITALTVYTEKKVIREEGKLARRFRFSGTEGPSVTGDVLSDISLLLAENPEYWVRLFFGLGFAQFKGDEEEDWTTWQASEREVPSDLFRTKCRVRGEYLFISYTGCQFRARLADIGLLQVYEPQRRIHRSEV